MHLDPEGKYKEWLVQDDAGALWRINYGLLGTHIAMMLNRPKCAPFTRVPSWAARPPHVAWSAPLSAYAADRLCLRYLPTPPIGHACAICLRVRCTTCLPPCPVLTQRYLSTRASYVKTAY
eukprot:1269839-Rhodomonas_salina.1